MVERGGLYGVDCYRRNGHRRSNDNTVRIVFHDVKINHLRAPEVRELLNEEKHQHIPELDYVARIEDNSTRQRVFLLIALYAYCPTYYYRKKFYIQKGKNGHDPRENYISRFRKLNLI